MPLSEHVYCVAMAFKMTEWVEQWICIRFWVKLKYSSAETIRMIQKAIALGNWWWAVSSQQHAHSCIKPHAEFSGETSNNPGDSSPYSPELVPCDIQLFPKLKLLWKGKRFQTMVEIQENMMGQPMAIGRTMWGPRWLLGRGLRCHCPMYNVSCILYFLQ